MSTTTEQYSDPSAPGAGGSATDTLGFDRGTGTGEPTPDVAHLLRLMKGADDGFNSRDFPFFLEKRHSPEVVVHQIGSPTTVGHEPHREDMQLWIGAFPDMTVHNDPYDIQFGQGEWTVAIGQLSGTFTQQLNLPNGMVVEPTGKSFQTFFTTIARWKDEQMTAEYVLFDSQDIAAQVGVGQ